MVSNETQPKKSNYFSDATNGIFEKYEMNKLSNYGVIIAITIINVATWLLISRVYNMVRVFQDMGSVGLSLFLLGIIIGLFSVIFLYFNAKTNFLIDERNKRLD